LEVIDAIGQKANLPKVHQELLRHAHLIQVESQAGALIEQDRERISQRCTELTDLLRSEH
jgi:hypothetical protein